MNQQLNGEPPPQGVALSKDQQDCIRDLERVLAFAKQGGIANFVLAASTGNSGQLHLAGTVSNHLNDLLVGLILLQEQIKSAMIQSIQQAQPQAQPQPPKQSIVRVPPGVKLPPFPGKQ